jgi:hypothetical protein
MMLKSPLCASALGSENESNNPASTKFQRREPVKSTDNIQGPSTTAPEMPAQDEGCLQYVGSTPELSRVLRGLSAFQHRERVPAVRVFKPAEPTLPCERTVQ